MIVRKIVAEIIDVFVLAGTAAIGIYLAGLMNAGFDENPPTIVLISQVCMIILIPIVFQSPFWYASTTIGKSLTYLIVVNGKKEEVGYFLTGVREVSKLFSVYFVCIPMLMGKPGTHETATQSHLIIKPKQNRKHK